MSSGPVRQLTLADAETGAVLHAVGEMHRRGLTTVSLGVDSENPSGATGLYERAGMSVGAEDVVYERTLT